MGEQQPYSPRLTAPAFDVEIDEGRHRRAWNGDNQGATNDDNGYNSIIIKNGYPVEYSCEDRIQNGTEVGLVAFEFEFDYEVTFFATANSTFADNVRALEWSVMWNIVSAISLDKCIFDAQQIVPIRMRRSLDEKRKLQSEIQPYVVMLGSEPQDSVDLSTEACSSIVEPGGGAVCVPMRGVMSAMHTGNHTATIKTYLLEQVATVMASDTILIQDVTNVKYIGKRVDGTIAKLRSANVRSNVSNEAQISSLGIGLVSVLCVLAVAIFGLFVRKFSTKSKAAREREEIENVNQNDIEEARAIEEHAIWEFDLNVPPPPVDQSPTSSTKSVSLPSKRKRRKKKKKKKKVRALEAVNEMETIREVEEEASDDEYESQYDSEYDSEYSTDDDNSDYRNALTRSSSTNSTLSLPSPPRSQSSEFRVDFPEEMLSWIAESPKEKAKKPAIRPLPPPWV